MSGFANTDAMFYTATDTTKRVNNNAQTRRRDESARTVAVEAVQTTDDRWPIAAFGTRRDESMYFTRVLTWAGIASFFGVLQVLTISMRINKDISWMWNIVFLWTYMFLAVLLAVSGVNVLNSLRRRRTWMSYLSSLLMILAIGMVVVQIIVAGIVLDKLPDTRPFSSWHVVLVFTYMLIGVCLLQPFSYVACSRRVYLFAFSNNGAVGTADHSAEDDASSDSDEEQNDGTFSKGFFGKFLSLPSSLTTTTTTAQADDASRAATELGVDNEHPINMLVAKWWFHVFLLGALLVLTLSTVFLAQFLDHCTDSAAVFLVPFSASSCETLLFMILLPVLIYCGIVEIALIIDLCQKSTERNATSSYYCSAWGTLLMLALNTGVAAQAVVVWAAIRFYWEINWHIVMIPLYTIFAILICVNAYTC